MDYNRQVACPKCNKLMLVSPQGCAVSATVVSETMSESVGVPKPSRLHTMALEDMVEQGHQEDLRQAVLKTRLGQNSAWAKENGRKDKLGAKHTFLHSKLFNCPYCLAELNLLLDITVVEAVTVYREPGDDPSGKRIRGVDGATNEFISVCRSVGALKAFEEAYREQQELKKIQGIQLSTPKSMGMFFATFLQNAKRQLPRHEIFTQIKKEFGKDNVQYWQSNGVGLITLDDQIFRFVPACLFEYKEPPRQSALQKVLIKPGGNGRLPEEAGAEIWIKSKFGYVPLNHQLFLSELRKKSKGAFANPSM